MLTNTHVEYDTEEKVIMPKGQRTDVADIITVDGKDYATVKKAQEILTELATELGRPRDYSRFAVFRLAVDHNIDIVPTPSANYYSVEGLYGLKSKLHPERGTHRIKHYSEEKKEQAHALKQEEGLSNREVARRLNVSYQTVNNWLKKLEESKGSKGNGGSEVR